MPRKPRRVSPDGKPPIPIIPQVWAMLHPPTYSCDLCQKPISEDQYDHHDGLCPECVEKYA